MRLFASSDRDYVSVNTLSRVIEKAQDLTGCRKAVDCEGDDPHREIYGRNDKGKGDELSCCAYSNGLNCSTIVR